MHLPSVKNLKVAGKRVLLRTNYDVPLSLTGWVVDETRIHESLPTIGYLLSQKAKIIIISHLGSPGGKVVLNLSLKPAVDVLSELVLDVTGKIKIPLIDKMGLKERFAKKIVVLENLRFDAREEANDKNFAKKLASLADFYVNDAFACSHRRHASIVGIPKFLPAAFGFDFLEEVKVLTKLRGKPQKPVVLLLGGVKEDKIEYAKKLIDWADWILVGGKLVEHDGIPALLNHHKIVGSLIKNGQDITMKTAEEFTKIMAKAKTIVWSGPMGNFYDSNYEQGTKKIAEAVVKSGAFSVAGGGDTEAAITKFGLNKKIDFISSGGGAMLAFLAEGTLPGIRAIANDKYQINNL